MKRVAIAVLFGTMVAAACSSEARDIEVIWQFDRFTIDSETEDVVADRNARGTPWVTLDSESMTGNAGCNEFGGTYEFSQGALLLEGWTTQAWCGSSDGVLMDTELAFHTVAFHGPPIAVTVSGDRMTWSHEGNSVEFVSVETTPTTEPFVPPPRSQVGQLDCSPGMAIERTVPDDGTDPLEIAQSVEPDVATVETWQPLRHSGKNADGEVIIELALGDMTGADYQVWTCED